MIGHCRAVIRAVLFMLWTGGLLPVYGVLFPFGWRLRRLIVALWHKGVCRICGIRVRRHGVPVSGEDALLVGNHVSYLDIPVLASQKDVTFVAKADVGTWPVFGFLARIAQTAFIERNPSKARKQKLELQHRLIKGENLFIFPEGTSSDGEKVLPFKTTLFQMVIEDGIREHCSVQAVTLAFLHDHKGRKLTREEQDCYTWYGDMTLMPHLWAVFRRKGVLAEVIFHPAVKADDFASRKELAKWAEQQVSDGLHRLKGHPVEAFAVRVPEAQKLPEA